MKKTQIAYQVDADPEPVRPWVKEFARALGVAQHHRAGDLERDTGSQVERECNLVRMLNRGVGYGRLRRSDACDVSVCCRPLRLHSQLAFTAEVLHYASRPAVCVQQVCQHGCHFRNDLAGIVGNGAARADFT